MKSNLLLIVFVVMVSLVVICIHSFKIEIQWMPTGCRRDVQRENVEDLTRLFYKRYAARPENTVPAASQCKKDSSKYFNMSADLFALFLEGITSFALCIHTIFRPFATTFV